MAVIFFSFETNGCGEELDAFGECLLKLNQNLLQFLYIEMTCTFILDLLKKKASSGFTQENNF